ncbi:alpha-hydroxy acid oxidase [Brevundimonas sp. BAL450]|uniref:alpha-hydroxy acid oxidase n=1 Tax=Brevundimonas sp. BAL450 TaxID=1708162 RepID=UPI001E2EE808|nr:alpha-hydroxy acid oxidase [Brevundimonas sp. BAL450]
MTEFLSLHDFEAAARKRLPRSIFAFVEAGSEDGEALKANRESWSRWAFKPRSLVDVSSRSQSVALFGRSYGSPFGIAPMGGAVVCGWRADLDLSTAAQEAGIPFVLSGAATTPLETVMEAAPGTWFQAYLSHDMARIDALLDRLKRAKVEVLVVTTDVAVMGNRENALRAGFSLPPRLTPRLAWDGVSHPRWLVNAMLRTLVRDGIPRQANFEAEPGASILARKASPGDRRSRLGWEHIRHIRRRWNGPLVLKGVLSVKDARLALSHRVDGLILSNHGGRQLSSAVSPLEVLPEIRETAPDIAIMIDGGLRRGGDVLKARALGADMAFLGRPFLYAVSVAGHAGVLKAAAILRQEIDRDLALLGECSVSGLNAESLQRWR